MPKAKTAKKTSSAGRRRTVRRRARPDDEAHPVLMNGNRATHVLVPVREYDRLIKAEMAVSAARKLEDPAVQWVDADDLALELAGRRIAEARRAKGLTQKQLGDKLKLPQSQISRIERNPDRSTVRTLKRIARALGVNVRALI